MRAAEFNLPMVVDDMQRNDDYFRSYFASQDNWRWRLPEVDDAQIKLNTELNPMNGCPFRIQQGPTLDSFAAFSAGTTTPSTNQAQLGDALAAIINAAGTAGSSAVTTALGGRTNAPAPIMQPAPAPTSDNKWLYIGGAALAVVLVVVLLKAGKK